MPSGSSVVTGVAPTEKEEQLDWTGCQKAWRLLLPVTHLTSSCLIIFLYKIVWLRDLELGNGEDNFLHLKWMQKNTSLCPHWLLHLSDSCILPLLCSFSSRPHYRLHPPTPSFLPLNSGPKPWAWPQELLRRNDFASCELVQVLGPVMIPLYSVWFLSFRYACLRNPPSLGQILPLMCCSISSDT